MNHSTIGADTVARTAILALALLNQLLAVWGRERIALAENDVYQLVTVCWTVGASLAAWWKNNSFTRLARQADAWRREQRTQQSKG